MTIGLANNLWHLSAVGIAITCITRVTAIQSSSQTSKPLFGTYSFLLISSPVEKKVSYVVLEDSEATSTTARPLVDAGLGEPHGIAVSADGTGVFIADVGLERIVHYNLEVLECSDPLNPERGCLYRSGDQSNRSLVVKGEQRVVVEGVKSEWVAVDSSGAVYFTEKERKSVSKLNATTVEHLIAGTTLASSLSYLSQQDVDSLVMAQTSAELSAEEHQRMLETTRERASTSIIGIYEASLSPHVGVPGGVAVDDESVYWGNVEEGMQKGAVASGIARPLELESLPGDGAQARAVLDSRVVINTNEKTYGVAVSLDKIVFTSEEFVYGMSKRGAPLVKLSSRISSPRGVAFDGDNTMFVADQDSSCVYSFGVGRLVPGLEIIRVVDISNPFGVAVLALPYSGQADGFLQRSRGARTAVLGGLAWWCTTVVTWAIVVAGSAIRLV